MKLSIFTLVHDAECFNLFGGGCGSDNSGAEQAPGANGGVSIWYIVDTSMMFNVLM